MDTATTNRKSGNWNVRLWACLKTH